MYLVDIGRKAKVARHVSVVLRWVIAIGDEADAQVLAGLQLARLVDVVTDELDVLRRGGDVGTLAPGAVLHEDEIAVVCYTSDWRVSASKQMRDDAHTASCGQARRVVWDAAGR
jgi:hypothetical protein